MSNDRPAANPSDAKPADVLARRLMSVARLLAGIVALGCGVVLFGYAAHIGPLVDLRAGLEGMSPITAAMLLVLALAVRLDARDPRRARVLALVAIGVGLVCLVAIALLGRDSLSPFLAARLFQFNAGRAGHVSVATGLCLVALGLAGAVRDRPKLSDWAATVALVMSAFALMVYAFGARDLPTVPLFETMTAHTAVSIFLLALASLAIRSRSGWARVIVSPGRGGRTVRRMLAFTLAPPAAAFLLSITTDAHRVGPGAAMAFLVVVTIVPLSLFILREGQVRDELERERRARMAARAESDRDIRLVTNALPVLIAFIDRDLVYRFANRAYEDWFYLPPEHVIGRKVEMLLDAEGMARRRDHFDRALAGQEQRFELAWPHRDGRPRDADIHYLPRIVADGSADGFYVFVADITDRKEAERRLVAINEILETRVEARTRERDQIWQVSTDMLCIASLDGFFVSLNPAWTTTLGWSASEMKAKPFMSFVHPDDEATTRQAAAELASGALQRSFENRYRHRDGDYRWFSWNAVPRDGLIYASVRDVTEAKQADDRQQVLEEQLRQSQKMEAVGQLTGGLAHDFNNLLTGITGSLDMLGARLSQGRVNDLDRYINVAQGAAKRAAALTHRLLAFSRRQTLDPRATDANKLVAGMEDMLRRSVGPAVAIEIVGAGGLWTILVDPNQLENALLNLCINARDAMADGGRITIETANKWLDDRAARERDLPPGQYVSLCVTDTGIGMTTEVIERVFDPFFTTKPLGQGTGLGLSMIYGFVRQSGGQVRIYSELGQGTTMCLYLPRHHGGASEEDKPPDTTSAVAAGHGETVLVVDDEPTVRMLVTEVLDDMGYTALEAADGVAAVKILRSNVAIDLLVTDVGLPGGMNGRQVADAGRAIRPGLQVLFITGYAENAVLGNGPLDPGTRLLTKPFAMDSLAATIKDIIDRGRKSV